MAEPGHSDARLKSDIENVKFQLIEAASKGIIAVFKENEWARDHKDISNCDKRTPLHLAAAEGQRGMVTFLLEEWKVNVLAKDRWGQTAYDEAHSNGHQEIANYLRENMGEYRKTLSIEQFNIINAAKDGDLSFLQRCKGEGMDMFFADYDKRTPLHLAAAEGHEDVAKFLIETCEMDANVKDRWGHTPVDEAERFGHKKVALLISDLNEKREIEKNKLVKREEVEHYRQTVKNGKVRRHCIRLNIVGHVDAGKTTLANAILEKKDESPEHTNSIDTHIYEAVATDDGDWKILQEGKFKQFNDETLAFQSDKRPLEVEDEHNERNSSKFQKKSDQPVRMFKGSHVVDIANFAAKKDTVKDKKNPPTFINIWDFGGHGIFNATHQIFHSTDSIYILVVDLSKPIDVKLDDIQYPKGMADNANLQTIAELSRYWVNTIHAYVMSEEKRPPIFLVGTHGDLLEASVAEERAENYFRRINGAYGEHGSNNIQNFFLIDKSSASIENVSKLKKAIFDYTFKHEEFAFDFPKKWIPLENSIQRKRKNNKCVNFESILVYDKDSLEPIEDKEEIKDFLAHQHRQGSVVYFRQPKLDSHVILDPQWLIDAYKSIITIPQYFKGNEKHSKELEYNARIPKWAFREIWNNAGENTFLENETVLLFILEKFGVIATPTFWDSKERREVSDRNDFYYIPSLLAQKTNGDFNSIFGKGGCFGNGKSTTPLQLQMKLGLLPPSQYNSIISAIMSKWPVLCHNEKPQLFVDMTIFVLGKDKVCNDKEEYIIYYFGIITMPQIPGNTIEITVYAIPDNKEIDEFHFSPRKCDKFRRFVETALKESLERFHVKSKNKYEVCLAVDDTKYDRDKRIVCITDVTRQWFRDSKETTEAEQWNIPLREEDLARISGAIGINWKILCVALTVPSAILDRISLSTDSVATQIFRGLQEWRKKEGQNATWGKLMNTLKDNPAVSYDLDLLKTIMEEKRWSHR